MNQGWLSCLDAQQPGFKVRRISTSCQHRRVRGFCMAASAASLAVQVQGNRHGHRIQNLHHQGGHLRQLPAGVGIAQACTPYHLQSPQHVQADVRGCSPPPASCPCELDVCAILSVKPSPLCHVIISFCGHRRYNTGKMFDISEQISRQNCQARKCYQAGQAADCRSPPAGDASAPAALTGSSWSAVSAL